MKKYKFTSKRSPIEFIIEANNEYDAIQKAYDLYGNVVTIMDYKEIEE